jgi:hypothetical protein
MLKLPQMPNEQIGSIPTPNESILKKTAPETPISLESTLERDKVIEKAQEERLTILKKHLESIKKFIDEHPRLKSITSNISNDAPLFGTYKQIGEAIKGETWDGKELTPIGRINHVIIHALYVYAISRSPEILFDGSASAAVDASIAYTASWFFDGIQYHPDTIANVMSVIEDYARKKGQEKIAIGLNKFKTGFVKACRQKLFFKEKADNKDGKLENNK